MTLIKYNDTYYRKLEPYETILKGDYIWYANRVEDFNPSLCINWEDRVQWDHQECWVVPKDYIHYYREAFNDAVDNSFKRRLDPEL